MTNDSTQHLERQGIQVLSRAAAILRYVEQQDVPPQLGDIAKALDLPRSTVQRIVDALAKEGLVILGISAGRIRLGPALLSLAKTAHYSVVEIARPTLESLAAITKESVVLTKLDDNTVTVLDQIRGPNRLVSILNVGAVLPFHCSASGKAIRAMSATKEDTKASDKSKLTRFTKNTITSRTALNSELGKIRETGISWDIEEHSYGVCTVAAAITNVTGGMVALAITMPKQHYYLNKQFMEESLQAHAADLQNALNM